jgi:hypothetical protein
MHNIHFRSLLPPNQAGSKWCPSECCSIYVWAVCGGLAVSNPLHNPCCCAPQAASQTRSGVVGRSGHASDVRHLAGEAGPGPGPGPGPDHPEQQGSLALRLTGQLLLGLVRVYNRKVRWARQPPHVQAVT